MTERKQSKVIRSLIIILIIGSIYWLWLFTLERIFFGDGGYLTSLELNNSFLSGFSMWAHWNNLGGVEVIPTAYPLNFLKGLLNLFLGNQILIDRIIFHWPAIVLPLSGSLYFFDKLFMDRKSALLAAIFYSFNTYVLFLTVGGHVLFSSAIGLAPIILTQIITLLRSKEIALYKMVLLGLTLTLLGVIEFRFLYMFILILFIFGIFFWREVLEFKNKFYLFVPPMLLLLLNAYWILPFINLNLVIRNDVFSRPLFGQEFMSIDRALAFFHPFWSGSGITPFVINKTPWWNFIFPVFAVVGFYLNRKNKLTWFFVFIWVLGVFLTKQNNLPFSGVYEWLFHNMPGFNAFREASKFYFYINLGMSTLLGYLLVSVVRNKKIFNLTAGFILVVAVFNVFPIITGRAGGFSIARHQSKDYADYDKFISSQPEFFRVLWLPARSHWPKIYQNHPDIEGKYIIGDKWRQFGKFSNLEDAWSNQDDLVSFYKKPFSKNLLSLSSIKYIIIPTTDFENDEIIFNNIFERQSLINKMNTINYLSRVNDFTDLVVYENSNFRPHLYLTQQKETVYKDIPFQKVNFKYVNPTEYKINIENLNKTTYLNFSESYHPDWSLRKGNFNWFAPILDKNYFLNQDNHFENDAKLNSFKLDPQELCENKKSCDLNLTLFFKAQSYAYLGLIVSVAAFIISIMSLVFCTFLKKIKISG